MNFLSPKKEMNKKINYIDPIIESEVKKASEIIKQGGIILYPTDTIWGIGCDATNYNAVERVFKIKNRKQSKSLVTLVADIDMLYQYVDLVPEIAINLIEVNDLPMTIIYPKAIELADNVIASDGSAAIRIPDNKFCKSLIYRCKKPIVSTSANISETTAPATFDEISKEIKEGVDYVVGQNCEEQKTTKKASQIIKVGSNGEIQIIRN